MTVFVISTIDWPSNWYVSGVASSKEKAEEMLKREYPDYLDWSWRNDTNLYAKNEHGSDFGWSVDGYEVDTL